MAQMKEQIKTLRKELNKMDISNLSDSEFKTLVIRMLKELKGGPQQHKKDRVRNEGFINLNKEQLTGK